MIKAMLERIAAMIRPYVKEWIDEACATAYAAGYEDASRRAHDLYHYGVYAGVTLASESEFIEELDPDVFDEIEGGNNES